MKRALSVLAVAAAMGVLPRGAWAQKPTTLAQAAEAYMRGDFAIAAQRWQQALIAGYDGPRVRYNLANALYRDGRIGEAIAHYLAAITMAPRDADIRANLQRALMERPQGPPAPSPSWLHALLAAVIGFFTLSEFALAAMVFYWLAAAAGIALLLGRGRRRTLRRATTICALTALLTAGLGVGRWWSYHHSERAVVTVETAEVHTGPGDGFETAQALTEGWIVRVRAQDGSWMQVSAEGGTRGWVKTSALALVRCADTHKEPEGRD